MAAISIGLSDLEQVGAGDMRNGSSETVSEFRSRWANAMIPAQQKTPEIEQEIQERINANQENTVQIHTSTKLSSKRL